MWKPLLVALQGVGEQDNAGRLDDYHGHDVAKLGHYDNFSKTGNDHNDLRQPDGHHHLWQLDDHDHGRQCGKCQRS
jgi:hypothetical protein